MKEHDSLDDAADSVELLLADCLAQSPGELSGAVDAACVEHPELARELRARVALLDELGVLEAGSSHSRIPEQLGDFRLIERIGGGGMGVVYLAVQNSLKRDVALKLVRPEQLYFAGARERFRREAEAIARLNHPGIVRIFTVGEHEGLPYFAMEHIPGCTLAEVLTSLRGRDPASLRARDLFELVAEKAGLSKVPPSEALGRGTWIDACVALLHQAALALQHAHDQGLLHRDIKPSNILLTPDGRALLCDFGLTSDPAAADLTRIGSQLGTLPYMSPEQARGQHELDARSDVYALGVTLYELLSLQLPYQGATPAETLRQIEMGEADGLRSRNRRIAEDVETVCLAAMERDLSRRYPSAQAFANDLQALLDKRPIRARKAGIGLRIRRYAQRHPARVVGLCLGLVVTIGWPTQRYLHARDTLRRQVEANHDLQRELDLTSSTSRFVLELFRRASSIVPAGEPLQVVHVLAFGVQTIEEELGDDPVARARGEVLLGQLLHGLRQNRNAQGLLDHALQVFELQGDQIDRRGLYDALLLAAQVDLALKDIEGAQAKLTQLSELHAESPPRYESHGRNMRVVQAQVHVARGEFDEASALFDEALEELGGDEESDDLEFGMILGSYGSSLVAAGRDAEAVPVLERALPILERKLHGRHADLMTTLSNIGLAHKKLGHGEEAAEAYTRAAQMAEQLWSLENQSTATLYVNLGALHDQLGDYEKALASYERASAAFASLKLEDSFEALIAGISSGAMLMRLERFEQAESRFSEWHEAQRKHLGGDHPFVAKTHANRAVCLAKLNRKDEALEQVTQGLSGLGTSSDDERKQAARQTLETLERQLRNSTK